MLYVLPAYVDAVHRVLREQGFVETAVCASKGEKYSLVRKLASP